MKIYSSVIKKGAASTLVSLALFLFCSSCLAQNSSTCNRDVRREKYLKVIPENICFPKGYLLSNVYESTDVDSDGLDDLVFKLKKSEIQNGDTALLMVYKQMVDSTFILIKELNNLFPLYFDSYDLDNDLGDERLNTVKNRYHGMHPLLKDLIIQDSNLTLRLFADVGYEYFYYYVFDNDANDWLLKEIVEYDTFEEEGKVRESPSVGTSIKEFSYFRYVEGGDF